MVDFFKVSMSFTQLLNHCESLREQAQTRLKQVDKNGFETVKNGSKLIRRASEIEALGLLGRGRGGGPPKIIDFHRKLAALEARFWGPFWNPFRFMMPSRVALDGKLTIWGGVWLQSIFLKRFCLIFGGVLGSENSDFAWEG